LALLLLPHCRQAAARFGKRLGRLDVRAVAGGRGHGGDGRAERLRGRRRLPSARHAQTYTVTVTGTSGALSHSTTVTLTVE
jgi:hypothetical protein